MSICTGQGDAHLYRSKTCPLVQVKDMSICTGQRHLSHAKTKIHLLHLNMSNFPTQRDSHLHHLKFYTIKRHTHLYNSKTHLFVPSKDFYLTWKQASLHSSKTHPLVPLKDTSICSTQRHAHLPHSNACPICTSQSHPFTPLKNHAHLCHSKTTTPTIPQSTINPVQTLK